MSADIDILIGLAALHVGLIPTGDLPLNAPEDVGPLLTDQCGREQLVLLRDRTLSLLQQGDWDLAHVVGALSDFMVAENMAGGGTSTIHFIDPDSPDAPGDMVRISAEVPGRYEYAKEHARGGMGRVLMVYDKFLTRRIALKELLPAHLNFNDGSTLDARVTTPDHETQQQRARFLYEARITAQLEHPSIVPVYELGRREDGKLYYTMRLVKGRSLRDAIRKADSLEARLALLPHFIDLCQAIAYAHSRSVIHRDIKPGNVMLGDFGETVVIDWGLAKSTRDSAVGSTEIDALRDAHVDMLGTPAYMPPEQASGNVDDVNERSDVYSLGAVLYELLTGAAPYPDKTPAAALSKLLAGPPPSLSTAIPSAPDQLMAICNHAMDRNQESRYQTAKELSTDVERFLSGRLVGAYQYSLRELFVHFVRSFKAPLIVGAIGMAAFFLTIYLSYQQIQTERDRAVAESFRALEAEQGALAAQSKAEQEFYFAAISSARKYIVDGRYEKAMDQLDKCPGRYRHWEWGYLLYLCNQDQRTFRAHQPETVWSLEYTVDNLYMISAGFDKTARFWSTQNGTLEDTYTSPYGAVIEISPHPTLPVIACAEETGYVSFYNYETHEIEDTWKIAEDDVNCIQFNADGSLFITGDDKGYIRLWEYPTRNERYVIAPDDRGIEALTFSPDGTHYASCDRNPIVTIRDTETGSVQLRLSGHEGRITALAYSPDGRQLASASRDGTLRVWNTTTGAISNVITAHDGTAVWALAYSPDGLSLASGGSDLTVRLWDTQTWSAQRVYRGHQKQVYALAYGTDGRMLVSGDDEGLVKQWDTIFPGKSTDMWALPGHTGVINQVAYSPDGALIATSAGDWKTSDDMTARIWDVNSGALIKVLEGHTASVRQTTFHPTEPVYATSSHDRTIRVWNRNSHTTQAVLGPFETGVNVAAFVPNKPGMLAAGLRNGHIVIVNWHDGTIAKDWQEHEREILGLVYSPNGRWLASGSADESAHVLDATNYTCVKTITEHQARVPSVAFSPDGRWLATGGHDWKINLWSTSNWQRMHTLAGHTQGIYTLQFSEDGRRIVSSGSDEATIIWDMSTFREVLQIQGWVSAMRPGNGDIVTGRRGIEAFVWPAFPWDPSVYGENTDVPLSERVEAYKQKFWQMRRK